MKKVLIICSKTVSKADAWLGFFEVLKGHLKTDVELEYSTLADLIFDISLDNSLVLDDKTGKDVASYDLVIISQVGKKLELGIALAQYLEMKKVAFSDGYLLQPGAGKLACAMLRARYDIPTPRTVYANRRNMVEYIAKNQTLTYPLILKSDNGKKGRDNYLIKSQAELEKTLADCPDIMFIAQGFIPNDGDLRVLVLGDKISLIIKRQAGAKGGHLNNTSQGGTATILPMDSLSPDIKDEVLRATKLEKLEVAGVDIIFNKETGQHYFLEINRAPQVISGSYVAEKTMAYADMIKRMV